MKRYTSAATLCFSVEHNDEHEITNMEFYDAIQKRISELHEQPDGFEQACDCDWFDTRDNEE